MADGIPTYSYETQVSKYKAGIQGSTYFGEPNPPPPMTVVDGYPPEVDAKLMSGPVPAMQPTDPWVYRYPNAKL